MFSVSIKRETIQEVKDFLTGERKENPEEKWIITDNPKLKIIDEDIFNKVKKIKLSRVNMFNLTGKRKSDKHIFSKLIKCSCCGYSFGRQVRTYQNTYIKWVCSGRNKNGTGSCTNKTVIDESANNFDTIIFSAGKIGYQVQVSLEDLAKVIRFELWDISE